MNTSYRAAMRRRAKLMSFKPVTFVNYIESHGSEYINTGIVPNASIVAELDALCPSLTTSLRALFGTIEYSGGVYYRFHVSVKSTVNQVEFGCGTVYSDVSGSPTSRLKYKIDGSNGKCYINDTLKHTLTACSGLTSPMWIGGISASWEETKQPCRIYGFKVYSNGALVMNLKPAIDSDDEVGMYDAVSGGFFKNSGTGAFTYG